MRPRLIESDAQRGPVIALGVIAGAIGALGLTVLTQVPPGRAIPVLAVGTVLVVWQRQLLAWRSLLAGILIVIFFLPIRRYTVPGNLPFQLEPYRLLVALVLAGWVAALLVDRRVRGRRTGLEGPFLLLAVADVGSVLVNWHRVQVLGVETDVNKALTFMLSFVLVVYLIASLVRSADDLDFLLRVLVGCGAVLAGFALMEGATGYNVFNHLSGALSFLRSEPLPYSLSSIQNDRGGRLRVYASAQDPIALSAALVMLVPVGVYLACKQARRWLWWTAVAMLLLGALAPLSRTGVLMLLVVGGMFLWLRPRGMRKLWPALIPALLVVHLALPGALGALTAAFTPAGGLIAQQEAGSGVSSGSGRLAHLGPSLDQWEQAPIFGIGYGTRVVDGPTPNAPILDDEWLGTLLETGIVGVLGWLWLYGRVLRRLVDAARADPGPHGLLCTALAAAVAAYAVGMLTYDAFSFIQVTFLLFFLLGLSIAAFNIHRHEGVAAAG